MRHEVILTCAVTGAGDTSGKSPHVPVTPKEIAESALAARDAGAAVVHIHVRDPETGKGAREFELFAEVVERVRTAGSDVILNLTAGMGADFVPSTDNPALGGEGSDMADAFGRVAHVLELKPELCTLDCGSMNYADTAYVSTPDQLREMAAYIRDAGVKPEIECFELGHIWLAKALMAEGLIAEPPLFQLCMGIPFGAPATTANLLTMRDNLPQGAQWAAFAIGKMEMPFVAQSLLLGGHVRVGLEDNLYLEKGVQATNSQLVDKARTIVETLGSRTVTPDRAREMLRLV
jgi:uncharacterized protein (DUF849 family)